MVSLMVTAQTFSLSATAQTHPVRVWGELGYDYRFEHYEGPGDFSEHIGVARINAATHLFEPWIANVDGGIGLNARAGSGDRGDTRGDQLVGHGILRIFPLSRFPLELFAERSDSSTETDIAGADILLTRYGLQQSYSAESGATARFRYEHTETENVRVSDADEPVRREDQSDLLELALNKNFGVHGLSFDTSVNRVDRVDVQDSTDTSFSSLRHTYRPGPTMSAEDLVTVGRSRFERETSDIGQDFVQLNSFARWRPSNDSRLRVNTTLRVLGREDTFEDQQSSLDNGTGTVGLTYGFNPNWFLTANAGASAVEVDEERSDSLFQAAGIRYTSDIYPLLGFDSTYFGQFDVENNNDSGSESIQRLGAQIGYDLSRVWSTGDRASMELRAGQSALGQNAAFTSDSQGLESRTLTSQGSLGWHQRGQSVSSMIGFALSDSRTTGSGENSDQLEGSFQMANLQASLNQRYGMFSSLSGNMTLQASRNDRLTNEGDGDWQPTTSIDLLYEHRRAFDVPRLSYRSNLRFISDSYFPVLGEVRIPDGRDDKFWENRFDYMIGRLQLRLTTKIGEIREQEQAFLLLQLRRLFGDL